MPGGPHWRFDLIIEGRLSMKVVVIGGTGLIGSNVVAKLTEGGHEAVPASPRLGVNTITGEGLAAALDGASVVIDVSNSPNFEYATALEFFETSTRNLLAAAKGASVGQIVALSVVGTKALSEGGDLAMTTAGYFRAKQTQESLIESSGLPYSIVHATQFFEFIKSIADAQTVDGVVRVPPVLFQPMAAVDVGAGVARVAIEAPTNGLVEIGGPEEFRFDEPVRRVLAAANDARQVVTDPDARYYGIAVTEASLVPGDGARLGEVRLEAWLREQAAVAAGAA
jgi:uncharacterized protein YbjT (DUF2867 family)